MSDLAAAAAAMGVPEALVKRSAEARARATGTSVDDILAAWAGGGAAPAAGCAAAAVRGWRLERQTPPEPSVAAARDRSEPQTSNLEPQTASQRSSLDRRDPDRHCSAAADRGLA